MPHCKRPQDLDFVTIWDPGGHLWRRPGCHWNQIEVIKVFKCETNSAGSLPRGSKGAAINQPCEGGCAGVQGAGYYWILLDIAEYKGGVFFQYPVQVPPGIVMGLTGDSGHATSSMRNIAIKV